MIVLFTCFQPGVCTWQWGRFCSQTAGPRWAGVRGGALMGVLGCYCAADRSQSITRALGNDRNIGQRKELWKEEFCSALS